MHYSIAFYGLVLLLVLRLLFYVFQFLSSPLRSVPGPLVARFTKLWYLYQVKNGHFEKVNIELHRKYGPVVRVAPNWYSIDDPTAIKTIYGSEANFPKAEWYEGWKHPSPDRWTLFPDRNQKRHADTRKRFSAMYSMSSLVNYEEYVDQCAEILTQRLTENAHGGRIVNMSQWFRCYAFDVIGNITCSSRFGFLDSGLDVDGMLEALERTTTYSSLIGIYANLHKAFFTLTSRFSWSGAGGRMAVMRYAQSMIDRRRTGKMPPASDDPNKPQDFLEKLMLANDKDPEKVNEHHIFMMVMSNIIAGSDTTSASLSAILYYLLKYPPAMRKLQQEVEQFRANGQCGETITFKESQAMPYLQAVMKEALRMHSATGLPLWREAFVDSTISGYYFPRGSVVGVNAWTAHYNKDVFGPDAEEFRPERWLEEENDRDTLKAMDAYYLPFGLGSRTCIGKHISILEMSKLIPQIITKFDFELLRADQSWKTFNHWFVLPKDFDVKVRMRKPINV